MPAADCAGLRGELPWIVEEKIDFWKLFQAGGVPDRMDTHIIIRSRALKGLVSLGLAGALSLAPSVAGEFSKYTADFYRGQCATYNDKEVTVKVTHVKSLVMRTDMDGLKFFQAHTFDDRKDIAGGWIIVAVPAADVDSFLRKYGTAPDVPSGPGKKQRLDANRLTGTLRCDGKRLFFIDYDNKCKEIIDARRQEIMERLAGAQGPDTREPLRGHRR